MQERLRSLPLFTKLWVTWALVGVGTALLILAVDALSGDGLPWWIWWGWAVPGVLGGAILETVALLRPEPGDTLSEHIWMIEGGGRSAIVTFLLWAAFYLATGNLWPSLGVFFLLWAAYHFAFEGPPKGRVRGGGP